MAARGVATSAPTRARAGAAGIVFHPLTGGRWGDLERLFGERGACGGCWCMWARLPRAEFQAGVGAPNKRALRRLVAAGKPPGILAYVKGEPAGWCAVGPRAGFRRLEASRILKPVDERPVWSIVCLFIARPFRRRGLSVRLLEEAARFAASRGATLVEGYPTDARAKQADAFVWTGLASAFERAGFAEVARRSRTRPIMRRAVRRPGAGAAARRAPAARAPRLTPRAVARRESATRARSAARG
jgi:GNAT superfamily N-acetyltransferase